MQRTYEVLQGVRNVASSWKFESFPVLTYLDHRIECIAKHTDLVDEHEYETTVIDANPIAILQCGSKIFEVNCELPIIHLPAQITDHVVEALDLVINCVAEYIYADGDYSVIEAFLLSIEKGVNGLFTDFLGQDVSLIRAQVSCTNWLAVRLNNKQKDPLLSFWVVENVGFVPEDTDAHEVWRFKNGIVAKGHFPFAS